LSKVPATITMIIYLYGPDSYRRQEKLKEIVANYKKKHSTITIDKFIEGEFERFGDFIKNQSLFDSFKLAIIFEAFISENKNFAELLKAHLNSKNIILLISVDKKLPKEFNFILNSSAETSVLSQSFEKLETTQIENFVKKEALKRDLKLPIQTINSLVRANSSDLWGIVNDLDKLELGGKLEESLAEPEFFSLINRVRRGDITALEILLHKQEPAMIFNIIASQAGPDLKEKMADYDVAIKSGKLDYEEALLSVILI